MDHLQKYEYWLKNADEVTVSNLKLMSTDEIEEAFLMIFHLEPVE